MDSKAEYQAQNTAGDVGQLRDVVGREKTRNQLSAQIKDHHENQGDRDFALFHLCERIEYDQHEYDSAGTQKRGVGEEDELHQSCNCRSGKHAPEDSGVTVFFLNAGPDQQEQKHIIHIMCPAAVPENMAEEANVGQRIRQRSPIHTEKEPGGIAVSPLIEKQGQQTKKSKSQYDRCIKTNDETSQKKIPLCKLVENYYTMSCQESK